MTDKITREDFAKLAAPFAAKDHEFNRGFIYIEETAVCARIEEVDLSFQWETMPMTPAENGIVTVVGALTIKGVTRYGTGQQVIQLDKNERETVGEARKGASTDALKRAARLFGIGRYLLNCPKEVKGYGRELEAWLREVAKTQGMPAPAPHTAPAPLNVESSKPAAPPIWWPVLKEYMPFMREDDFGFMRNELSEHAKTGSLHLPDAARARTYIEKNYELLIDMDAKRAAAKEAS
jgi:hypothetical protein